MAYYGDDDHPSAIIDDVKSRVGGQRVYFRRETFPDGTIKFLEGARGGRGELDPVSHVS
jgi:hypothetical protein